MSVGLSRAARDRMLARLAIVALSFGFRLPEIVHAREVNSDSAIVGLQAMHVLRGEWSAFLWGSGYQSSADTFVAAGVFALFGKSAVCLVLSALGLHVVATLAVAAMGERHARLARLPKPAFVGALVALPLVFTTAAIHTYALYPPRQASITLAIVGLVLVDRASASRRRYAWLFFGCLLATLACAADPYALVFLPLAAGSAFLSAFESTFGTRVELLRGKRRDGVHPARGSLLRIAIAAAGALVGALPMLALWRSQSAKMGVVNMDGSRVAHNLALLRETCGPWAFGATSFYARHMMDYGPWEMPRAYALFAKGAVCIFLALFPAALLLSLFMRKMPFATRRAGLTGALALPLTLYGFLTSVMVMDHFSMRYLASVPLLLPFALVPLVKVFGSRKVAALIAAPLVAAGVSGWVSFGPDVRGPFVAEVAPGPTDEERVVELLAQEGVTHAMADYWTAYRVTYVTEERLVVVPTHTKQDRYRPYRDAFEKQKKVAYLVDSLRSGEAPDAVAEALAKGDIMGPGKVSRRTVGRFSVFVVERAL